MRTIYKYPITLDKKTIDLPPEAIVLHVEHLPSEPGVNMWVELEHRAETIPRTFLIHGTGHPLPEGWTHRGTAVGTPFVWHLYEQDQ